MGKDSVAQIHHDVPGGASRDVFQGLFKDLGKQAMALEAILRAVCGRVDKMENWLTEVSFGMTELDLKLRNIAHNIDGTAAVDDEGQGPHRWAIPLADDAKPIALTVSKKLGTDKKAVRVTGMAAAILDRLATTSESPPTAVEREKPDKSNTKKKTKDKKHGTKKVKAGGLPEVPATPSPAVVETAPPPAIPLPTPAAEAKQASAPLVEPEFVTAPLKAEVSAKPVEQVPAHHADPEEADKQEEVLVPVIPTIDETPAPIEKVDTNVDNMANSTETPVKIESAATTEASDSARTEEGIADPSNTQSENVSSENGPVTSAREETNSDEPKEQSTSSVSKPEVQGKTSETDVSPVENDSLVEEADNSNLTTPPLQPSVVQTTEPQPSQPATPVPSPAVDTTKVESVKPLVMKPSHTAPVPSISSILPTVTVERIVEPFVLTSSAQTTSATTPPASPSTSSVPNSLPAQTVVPVDIPNSPKVSVNSEPASAPPMFHHTSSPITESKPTTTPEPTTVVRKAIKTVGVPIRVAATLQREKSQSLHDSEAAEPTADPLLPHRTTAHRRSSKMLQSPSFTKLKHGAESDTAHRLSTSKRGSQSRRASIVLQAQVVQLEPQQPTQIPQQLVQESPQLPQQPAPALVSIPQDSAPPAESTSAIENEVDVDEESGESGSETSSDESGSSSGEEELEEDEEAGAAVAEISKTMTALKKLKKAHMLSPEEENELKDRAHKKWFQLKGHIKEKQKKDVTNILLKRKKNVFTVSSRIELLEEKSREIFAALKQITSEMRDKNDRAAHDTLRRRVADIEQSLLSIDTRIASLSAPGIEKVSDLESEVVSLRTAIQLQLITAQGEITAKNSLLEEALVSQRTLIESLAQDVPTQLNAQTELFLEKLKQQPDYNAAIENLKRSLRRKADLKLLKELEARLLGLDAENEDCLVRCLSCRKEVTHPYSEVDTQDDEQEFGGTGTQLRKVNPGPSSARIYRSNVPFSAQTMVQESILEEFSDEALIQTQTRLPTTQEYQAFQQHQSAGDSFAGEKPPVVRVPGNEKWSTPPTEINLKKIVKTHQASPLSLMNVTATRAILSPDRPISAPVVAMKRKSTAAVRSKSLLKSLPPQPEPPQ